MTSNLNNSNSNIYNFPFLNIPKIRNNEQNNELTVSTSSTTFTFKNFLENYKGFEENNNSKINNELLEFNIQNKKYQPNPSKKANKQISQLYILPEFYILYSKLYSSFQDRQQSTFDFLESYDDFYRLSQYTFSHENPNIRSINELLRTNDGKTKNMNSELLFTQYEEILNNIKSYQTDNDIIFDNIIELFKTFKNIKDKNKASLKELNNKISSLFTKINTLLTQGASSNLFTSLGSMSNTKNAFNLGINSNNEKLNSLSFNKINEFIKNLKSDLNNFDSDKYFNPSSHNEDTGKISSRKNLLNIINEIEKMLKEISFTYFKCFYKNINNETKSLATLYKEIKLLTNPQQNIDNLQIIKNIQNSFREDNLNYDSLINKIKEYVSLKSKKDEELQVKINKLKESIQKDYLELKENLISKDINKVESILHLKDVLNKNITFSALSLQNSEKNEYISFIIFWIDILIKIKCDELNLIKILMNDKSEGVDCPSKEVLNKTSQSKLKNEIYQSLNILNSKFTNILEEIKNKKEDFNSDIKSLESENDSLKIQIDSLDKILNQPSSEYPKGLNSEISTVNNTISRLDGEIKRLEDDERRLAEKFTKQLDLEDKKRQRDEESTKLKKFKEKKQEILTQKYKIESKRDENISTIQVYKSIEPNLKTVENDIKKDSNLIRKEKIKSMAEKMNDVFIILARIDGLTKNFEEYAKKLKEKSTQNELIRFFQDDTLYKKMKNLVDTDVIKTKVRGTNVVENNRSKKGVRRYFLRFNKSVESFKSSTLPFLIEYYEEKMKYHNEKQSILAAFTFNVGDLSKLTESTYKNLESQKLELNSLLTNISVNSTSVNSSSSSSSSSSSGNSSSVSRYGRSGYSGGANENAGAKNKKNGKNEKNKKNKINIYLETIGKKLDILKNKYSSNLNYQNRIQIFINTIDSFDKSLSEKILKKLYIIQKMSKPVYHFVFAQQVRFIIRRLIKIKQFIKNLENSSTNNSFNLMSTYYTTDLFLMYLSLNIVFYNFICCIHSKTSKINNSMNYY